MARIAFVTWDGGGNVPPAVGIAQALASGHRATVPVTALAHSAVAGLVPPPDSPVGATRLAASNELRASAAPLPPMRRLDDAWEYTFLTLVTTVAALDPAAADRGPLVRYVGPIVERYSRHTWNSPWDAADPRPLVHDLCVARSWRADPRLAQQGGRPAFPCAAGAAARCGPRSRRGGRCRSDSNWRSRSPGQTVLCGCRSRTIGRHRRVSRRRRCSLGAGTSAWRRGAGSLGPDSARETMTARH